MHLHYSIYNAGIASILLGALCASSSPTLTSEMPLGSWDDIARRYTRRTEGGIHLPIVRTQKRLSEAEMKRRGLAAEIGLGDSVDVAYTVLATIGGISVPLILDSGSSDTWVMSDACLQDCMVSGDNPVPLYPQANYRPSGLDVEMLYGDSQTGTSAKGTIGQDTFEMAGLALQDQYFAAINVTNTNLMELGASGILGLGFPMNSVIWNDIFVKVYHLRDVSSIKARAGEDSNSRRASPPNPNAKFGANFPYSNALRRLSFPDIPSLISTLQPTVKAEKRQTVKTSSLLYSVFSSYATLSPFFPRLISQSVLNQPMFSVALQRNTIDVGGSLGVLSIGELPDGISSDNMTWVPLRVYSADQNGLPAPPDSPNEVYPVTWEVTIDNVYLDGEKLPQTNLTSSTIGISALVDTGNSLIRGPADVVKHIRTLLSQSSPHGNGHFPCSTPHTLAFEIGGKIFPVDPRDFASQAYNNNVEECYPNLVDTDTPRPGGYLFSWSLGVPFLKSVTSSYYFGNLSYPSKDPPKMGFLSTVPADADQKMKDAVEAARKADHNFPAISDLPRSGSLIPTRTGMPQATLLGSQPNGAARSGHHHVKHAKAASGMIFGMGLALAEVFGL
ncbi:aspartic peptidase domain-containing protein [Panaeolus papilionaceus]|nr:aspartic peptidase domain-containing protein [Panaeolus papilionaceus]